MILAPLWSAPVAIAIIARVAVILEARRDHHPGLLVEDQPARPLVAASGEFEHAVERARDGVHRAPRLDPLAEQPIVLDEAQNRSLIEQRMIDVVALCEW